MRPNSRALALSASALLFLALGALTSGVIFFGSFAAASILLALDAYRYVRLAYDVKRNLRVMRRLSRSELLLGSTLTVAYDLEYGGSRRTSLPCHQPGGPRLVVKEPAAVVDLGRSRQTFEFEIVPSSRGKHTIAGLSIALETALFRGTATEGSSADINAYPHIDIRPGRTAARGPIVGDEAVREGSGADFSHLREYVPGDSVRHVDWARSSRYGELVVKNFEDVRPKPAFLLIDVDASMETGQDKTELESAVELATLISGQVLLENERVGVACFSGSDVTAYVPMAAGKSQMARIRQLLAAVRAEPRGAGPRHHSPPVQEALAAQKAFGELDALVEEAVRQFNVNVREDGFIKAILKVSQSSGGPCRFVVATNLSMGMASLLNGVRIARYFGHDVTVALAPHVWYELRGGIDADAGRCYRRYREAMESIARLRSYRVDVVEMSAVERPEEALQSGRTRRIRGVPG
ncbi:MAG TPA: DUF58 domain-containing protein [Methanocella sp.]|nr:DUF58 domain-containing protein [Methanocella sp.]